MKKYSFIKAGWMISAFMMLISLITVSCNKPFPDTLESDVTEPVTDVIDRKTMLIIVDGAVGTEVKSVMPPTLSRLSDFSIFSWDGLNDFKNHDVTNALSWTTLLTGTNKIKHNVTGGDFAGHRIATYPSLFTRLKQVRPDLRTAAFSSSPELIEFLAGDATVKNAFAANDAAVKQAAIAELRENNPSFVMAQFSDVDKAGANTSYSSGSIEYRNAIMQVDANIGELIDAMEARPGFDKENWMVIITSNKGSQTPYVPVNAPWSAFEDQRHNTFFICYNPRFKSREITKPTVFPYLGTSPLYSGTLSLNTRAKVLDGGDTYDIGSTGNFTIQCKVKVPPGNYNYPAFLSKRAAFSPGTVGWVFFMGGGYWQINFGQTGLGNRQIRGDIMCDGKWHTLTAVIKQEGTARNVYTYTDGVLYPFTGNRNIAGYGNLNSPQPLTVGNLPPDNLASLKDYYVTDIRFYNTDLSEDYIAANYCKTDVEASDPYRDNLLGFWPATHVTPDKKMLDHSGNGKHLVIESYKPGTFSEIINNICPSISDEIYKTVPNGVDLAVQIYQWFGIAVPPAWELDGKNWVPSFVDIGN